MFVDSKTLIGFIIGAVVTYFIERLLDLIAGPAVTRLSTLKLLDWFIIGVIVIGTTYIIVKAISDRRKKREAFAEVYKHGNYPYSLDKLFEMAQSEICWVGITLESLNHSIPTIKKALKRIRVKILICSQDSKFMSEIEKLVVSTNTKERIVGTLGMLGEILTSSDVSEAQKKNLEIKIYQFMPTHSMTIVDPNIEPKKYIQVDPYPYKAPQEERRIFVIPGKKKELVEMYIDCWNKMWKDGGVYNYDKP